MDNMLKSLCNKRCVLAKRLFSLSLVIMILLCTACSSRFSATHDGDSDYDNDSDYEECCDHDYDEDYYQERSSGADDINYIEEDYYTGYEEIKWTETKLIDDTVKVIFYAKGFSGDGYGNLVLGTYNGMFERRVGLKGDVGYYFQLYVKTQNGQWKNIYDYYPSVYFRVILDDETVYNNDDLQIKNTYSDVSERDWNKVCDLIVFTSLPSIPENDNWRYHKWVIEIGLSTNPCDRIDDCELKYYYIVR